MSLHYTTVETPTHPLTPSPVWQLTRSNSLTLLLLTRLLHIFATCPAPTSPRCITERPMRLSSGLAARTARSLPPHCRCLVVGVAVPTHLGQPGQGAAREMPSGRKRGQQGATRVGAVYTTHLFHGRPALQAAAGLYISENQAATLYRIQTKAPSACTHNSP